MENLLICPKCKSDLKKENKSLICGHNHCYDISKSGYVNLLLQKASLYYTKDLFKSRNYIFKKGFYKRVAEIILDKASDFIKDKDMINLLDVGCGEGYYSGFLKENLSDQVNITGFDLSKDAITIAAKENKNCIFFIGDLKDIPIKNNSQDVIIDVLTPSNYQEFKRVLKSDSLLIKVIPGKNYLIELRNAFSSELRHKELENDDVVNLFMNNYEDIDMSEIEYDMEIDDEDFINFSKMTPMLSSIESIEDKAKDLIKQGLKPKKITINFKILTGKQNTSK